MLRWFQSWSGSDLLLHQNYQLTDPFFDHHLLHLVTFHATFITFSPAPTIAVIAVINLRRGRKEVSLSSPPVKCYFLSIRQNLTGPNRDELTWAQNNWGGVKCLNTKLYLRSFVSFSDLSNNFHFIIFVIVMLSLGIHSFPSSLVLPHSYTANSRVLTKQL